MPYPFSEYDSKYRDYHTYKLVDNHASTNLVFIKSYNVQKGARIHRHEFFQINYVARGNAKHYLVGNSFDIQSGDIFIIPPYIPHMIADAGEDGCSIVEFEFAPELINRNFRDFDDASQKTRTD
jgi:mannose-6-phosphate isomerase-like protein (cupin superfamily)